MFHLIYIEETKNLSGEDKCCLHSLGKKDSLLQQSWRDDMFRVAKLVSQSDKTSQGCCIPLPNSFLISVGLLVYPQYIYVHMYNVCTRFYSIQGARNNSAPCLPSLVVDVDESILFLHFSWPISGERERERHTQSSPPSVHLESSNEGTDTQRTEKRVSRQENWL